MTSSDASSVPTEERTPGVAEVGGLIDGERVTLDRRLFIQLLAYTGCDDTERLLNDLRRADIPAVVYLDVNDPAGVAIVVAYENPELFVTQLRPVLRNGAFAALTPRPDLTMLGRTYAVGYEKDLQYSLLTKPLERLASQQNQWAIWYPLRRRGLYETLTEKEQHEVQVEHMRVARSFSKESNIVDVRLACHGLDAEDNDFIVGLLGPRLAPLSIIVQLMRKSTQTSTYIEKLGPFFVGRVAGRTVEHPDSQG